MNKFLLTGLAVLSISSCLDDDDNYPNNIKDRLITIDHVTMVKDTFDLGEKLVGSVNFSFNPGCETLYPSYYLEMKEIDSLGQKNYEAKIARFAQVDLNKQCDETTLKDFNDSIFINVYNAGDYTLKFYSGKNPETDSAKFIVKKIHVRQTID